MLPEHTGAPEAVRVRAIMSVSNANTSCGKSLGGHDGPAGMAYCGKGGIEDPRAKRQRCAYNNFSTKEHARNLISVARAMPLLEQYGFYGPRVSEGEMTYVVEKNCGIKRYEEVVHGPQPRGEGFGYDIDGDEEFYARHGISTGTAERAFLETTAEAIGLLGVDLGKAYDLGAETCADEIVALITELHDARLECMQSICYNCNLVSWNVFDSLPGRWRPSPPPSPAYCPNSPGYTPPTSPFRRD